MTSLKLIINVIITFKSLQKIWRFHKYPKKLIQTVSR